MSQRNNILAELQEISPLLRDTKLAEQKPAVPAGYFDSLGDVVISQIQEPGLTFLSGKDENLAAGMPADYFDGLPDQVMDKIRQQEVLIGQGSLVPTKSHTRILYLKRFAVAASLVGVILLGIRLFQKTTLPAHDCEDGIACLTREEIRLYVNEHIDEFEAEQIHAAFQPEIETGALENTVLPAESAPSPAINEETIEKYIEDNPATIDFEDASMDIF